MMGPTYDREAAIERCAVCDGYLRRFEGRGRTCAAEDCPGHVTGGVLTEEILVAETTQAGERA